MRGLAGPIRSGLRLRERLRLLLSGMLVRLNRALGDASEKGRVIVGLELSHGGQERSYVLELVWRPKTGVI